MRTPIALVAAILSAAMVLPGCGGSSSPAEPSASRTATPSSTSSTPSSTTTTPSSSTATTPAPSKARKHVPTVELVEISSPSIPPAGQVPVRFTCDGSNTWPTLDIKGIPANTTELVLELIKAEPVNNKLVVAWGLAGLSPKLKRIQTGQLPPGAIVARNGYGKLGYNLCPNHKTKEEYVYVLFAVPHALHPKPGFEPLAVRTEALRDAEYEGFLVFTYPRR
jgi:phosphatidylethanolamine-binding protein (PEBP) family uncharacterized protein